MQARFGEGRTEKCRTHSSTITRRPPTLRLQERREAYRLQHKSLTAFDQINELPAMKAATPEYTTVPSHVLQDVLRRLDKAFAGFFRRVKAGQTPGFPRFAGRNRFNSFTYPDRAGWKLEAGKLGLTGIGAVRVLWHRELQGTIKTVTIRREADQWYVAFSCAVDVEPEAQRAGAGRALARHVCTIGKGSIEM